MPLAALRWPPSKEFRVEIHCESFRLPYTAEVEEVWNPFRQVPDRSWALLWSISCAQATERWRRHPRWRSTWDRENNTCSLKNNHEYLKYFLWFYLDAIAGLTRVFLFIISYIIVRFTKKISLQTALVFFEV